MSSRPKIPKERKSRMHIVCPNCGYPMWGVSFKQLSPALTEVRHRCSNPLCKIAVVAYHEIKRITQAPGVLINTQMDIQLSKVAKATLEAMLDLPVAQSDDDLELVHKAMPQGDMFFEQSMQDCAPSINASPPGFPEKAHSG